MVARRSEPREQGRQNYPGRMYGSGFANPRRNKPGSGRRSGEDSRRSRVTVSAGSRVPAREQPNSGRRRLPRTFSLLRKIQNHKYRISNTITPIKKRVFAGLLIFVIGFAVFSFSGVDVNKVEHSGSAFLFYDPSVYDGAVVAGRSNMGPISRSNILLFNSDSIRDQLNELSDVSNVHIKKDYWRRTVRVVVETQPPSVIWSSSGRQFVINADGLVEQSDSRIMSRQAAKEAGIPYVEDTANSLSSELVASGQGQQAVSPQLISFMAEIYSLSLSTPRLTVNHFEVGSITQEVTVVIDEFSSVEVKMNFGSDATAQFKTLLGAAVTLNAEAVKPLYIDVRVPGRAVYREQSTE